MYQEKAIVQFYIDKDEPEQVFAFFPHDEWSRNGREVFYTSYSHIGQHSGCSKAYVKECQKATPEQYAALKKELEGIGYEVIVTP